MVATPVLRDILSDVLSNILTDVMGESVLPIANLGMHLRMDSGVGISGARGFDGTDDYFRLLAASAGGANFGTGDFFISGAFSFDNVTGNEVLVAKFDGGTGKFWKFERSALDAMKFLAFDGVTKVEVIASVTTENTFRNTFSLSVDRDNAANTVLYLNGQDFTLSTPTVSTDDIDNDGNLFIGQSGNSSLWYAGQLSNLGIGKTVLTAAEHIELHNFANSKIYSALSAELKAKFTLYYQGLEAVADDMIDIVGGNDATVFSAPQATQGHATRVVLDATGNTIRGQVEFTSPDVGFTTNIADGTPDRTAKDDDNDNHGAIRGHDSLTCWDTSGRGNHLTLFGFTSGFAARTKAVATGATGRALIMQAILTGSPDERGTAGLAPDLDFGSSTDFTIEGWLRLTRSVTGTPFVITKHGAGTAKGWEIVINTSGRLIFFLDDTSNNVTATDDGDSILDFAWHHFAITFDRDGNATRYVDGSAYGSVDDISSVGDISNAFTVIVGQRNDLPVGRHLEGAVDSIRVYNRVLTAAEVLYRKQIHTGAAATPGDDPGTTNVLVEWGFEDDARTTDIPSGATGTSLRFDGQNDRVFVGTPAILDFGSGDFTFAAWVRIETTGEFQDVISQDANGTPVRSLFIHTDGRVRFLNTDSGGDTINLNSAGGIDDFEWHFVAGVRSGTTTKLYVDELAVVTGSNVSLGDTDASAATVIGDRDAASHHYLKGGIDRCEIYSRALTDDEILYIKRAGEGSTGGTDPTTANRVLFMGFDETEERSIATLANGESMEFNGTADYIEYPNIGSPLKTITFWIKPDDITTRKIIDVDGTDQIELDGSGNVVATSFPGTTKIYVNAVETAGPLVAGEWAFIAVTDTTGVNGTAFDLGRAGGSNLFDGMIDDLRTFTVVKTQAEIYDLLTGVDDTTSTRSRSPFDDSHQGPGSNTDIISRIITRETAAIPNTGALTPLSKRYAFLRDVLFLATTDERGILNTSGINGKPTVTLQSDGWFGLNAGLVDILDFWVVLETPAAFSADETPLSFSATSTAIDYYMPVVIDSGGKVNTEYNATGGTNNRVQGDTVLAASTAYAINVIVEDGIWKVWVNDTAQTLTPTAGSNQGRTNVLNANFTTLGALRTSAGVSKFFKGKIADIFWYQTPSSADRRASILSYVQDRYNITV